MANRKTKPADLDALFKLLEAAKGENRSFREYARAAGVQHSIFNRIKRKEFVPGLLTLQKLTSEEAAPQNGVTLSKLWQAAGAPEIDFDGISRSLTLVATAAHLATAQVDFRKIVLESIANVLNDMGVGFTVDDIDLEQIIGLDFGGRLLIHNEPISALWFQSWYASSEKDYGECYSPEDKAIALLREPVILDSDPLRKYVIAVNSQEVYEALRVYAGKTSYRGWLSTIMIDSERSLILSETIIASFTGRGDDPDPLALAENN